MGTLDDWFWASGTDGSPNYYATGSGTAFATQKGRQRCRTADRESRHGLASFHLSQNQSTSTDRH
jgi:hypothetical protein